MEEERLHREKWRLWNEQREKEQVRKKLQVQEGMENYAVNLIQKMSEGRKGEKGGQGEKAKELNRKMTSEIESNVCSICLELMIPPLRQPVILFPCGHNICKDCLFLHPPDGLLKKGLKLKLEKCSLCRQKIDSYALNHSLMTLICTYSNNKDLIQKEEKRLQQLEEEEQVANPNCEYLKIRCSILEEEQRALAEQAERVGRSRAVAGSVVETLRGQKRRNERELEKLEEEGRLIAKCLGEKVEEMELLERELREVQDKARVVEKALLPLRKEKEKQELLEVARLLSNK